MTMRLWCAISGHGFGHAGQTAPVLQQLARLRPDLVLHLTTSVPAELLRIRLKAPFTIDPLSRDVGVQQKDALTLDVPATMAALCALHENWHDRLEAEQQQMRRWRPDLVLANIPYLTLAAAQALAIPTVALASISWDVILAETCLPYLDQVPEQQQQLTAWIATMREAYRRVDKALLLEPALPGMPFIHPHLIPPMTTQGQSRPQALRGAMGWSSEDQRPLFLVTLGGIAANTLPLSVLAVEDRALWLVDHDRTLLPDVSHVVPLQRIRHQWSFPDIIASVDGVVSKPGYGMSVDCVMHRKPLLYVKRGWFPDEGPISRWLVRHGRVHELSLEQFNRGNWFEPLYHLWQQPAPPMQLVENGSEIACEALLSLCS
ncbi:MAG: hypothetical protein HQL58_06080 [Magnetococcales bacterium]|nr:hypothetical protein [Magnetococcales bacterium]